MNLKSADLRPGMWLLSNGENHYILVGRVLNGWFYYDVGYEGEDEDSDGLIDTRFENETLTVADHPANVGPLLQIARDKHGAPALQVSPVMGGSGIGGWVCYRNRDLDDRACWPASTEFGALLAALEAAP